MTTEIVTGGRVQANAQITEENFNDAPLWVHAEPGELGSVQGVEEHWATVTWDRTGTTYDTRLDDLTPVLA